VEVTTWTWEEVEDVRSHDGILWINGRRFCEATGHVKAHELRTIAKMNREARAVRISELMSGWFRPAHLRREATVFRAHTSNGMIINAAMLLMALAISGYVIWDGAGALPEHLAEGVADSLPLWIGYMFLLHIVAVVLVWVAHRRLVRAPKRRQSMSFFSALMLPPQAMRLRALAGEGFWSVQHPLAYILAFTRGAKRDQVAFQVVSDLQWPISNTDDGKIAHGICTWHRDLQLRVLDNVFENLGISSADLLKPPRPNSARECSYCPRCRDQFVIPHGKCPLGISLEPLICNSDTKPSELKSQ